MFYFRVISFVFCAVFLINFNTFADVGERNINFDNIVTEYYTDDIYQDVIETSTTPVKNELEINAKSSVLMEVSTGKIIYKKNENAKLQPASITKIMTMILVVEALESKKISFYDKVITTEHAASMGGSQIWLETGEKMTVHDLLKAVAVGSANDASVALAEHISGSEEGFVAKMNQKAKEIGMNNTNFTNACGLDDENLYTTAKDVAIMSRELIKHDIIKQYTTIWMDTVRNETVQLVNTNKLVRFYKGATGLKTGTTNGAGCCVSATAKRNGMELIAVVMGAKNSNERFLSARKLLDYGFANYTIYNPNFYIKLNNKIKVLNGQQDSVKINHIKLNNELIKFEDKDNIKNKTNISKELVAPISKKQKVGNIKIYLNDKVINEYEITTINEAKELDFKFCFMKLLKLITTI